MLGFVGVIIILITVFFNIGLTKLLKSKTLKHFNKTDDIEKSLSYMRGFNKIYFFTTMISLIFLIFGIYLILRELFSSNKVLYYIAIGIAIIIYLVTSMINNKILLQAEFEIKGSKRNKQQEKLVLKLIGLFIVNYSLLLITYIIFLNIGKHLYFTDFVLSFYIKISIFILGFIILFLLSYNEKKILDYIFKPIPLYNEEIEAFVYQVDPDIKLYYFKANDLKMANAFVTEKNEKAIYITDYLLNNTTVEEQKAIFAHELGHIEMKHISKRSLFNLFGYLLGISIQYFLLVIFNGDTLFSSILVILVSIIYYIVLKNKFYQMHERMADAYMIKLGIAKEDAINVLEKLSALNYYPKEGEKSDQVLKTHPTIEKRIKYLKRN